MFGTGVVATQAQEMALQANTRIERHEQDCSLRQAEIIRKFDDISAGQKAVMRWIIAILLGIVGAVALAVFQLALTHLSIK